MSAYSAAVLADSPLAYWRCDDNAASTTVTDLSGNGHTGTSGPAANTSALSTAGALLTDSDLAFKADAAEHGFSCTIDLSAFARITLEFWLKWPTQANDGKNAIQFVAGGGASHFYTINGFVVGPNEASSGKMAVGFASLSGLWLDNLTRLDANWHHWVVDMDRATPANKLYIDGALQTTTTDVHNAVTYGNFANAQLVVLAASGDPGAPINTCVDEVAIYSGGLTSTRVSAHYTAATIASGPANVKTVAGLTKTNVKTVAGLPITSVKTIAGLG